MTKKEQMPPVLKCQVNTNTHQVLSLWRICASAAASCCLDSAAKGMFWVIFSYAANLRMVMMRCLDIRHVKLCSTSL